MPGEEVLTVKTELLRKGSLYGDTFFCDLERGNNGNIHYEIAQKSCADILSTPGDSKSELSGQGRKKYTPTRRVRTWGTPRGGHKSKGSYPGNPYLDGLEDEHARSRELSQRTKKGGKE